MEYLDKLKRLHYLNENYERNQDFNDNSSLLNEYNKLYNEFQSLYGEIRLRTGLDPGEEYNFDKWLVEEHKKLTDIENLLNRHSTIDELETEVTTVSELDEHMKSFDDLGFNNQIVYDWHRSILEALENAELDMAQFYYSEFNMNNKVLFQHIILQENIYNFLDSKSLINTGYCPIIGDEINNTYDYNIYGRKVYLSESGSGVCKAIDQSKWKNEYSEIVKSQNLEQQSEKKPDIGIIIMFIIAPIISWLIIPPYTALSVLGFFLLSIVFIFILIFGYLFLSGKMNKK